MQGRRFADYQRSVIVERGEEEQVGRCIDFLQTLAVMDVSKQGHVVLQAQSTNLQSYLTHRITRTDHEQMERQFFYQRECIEDKSDILLPYMLSDEKEHGLIGRQAQLLTHFLSHHFDLRLRCIEVITILDHLYMSLESILAERRLNSRLGDPHFIRTLEDLDDMTHHPIDDELAFHVVLKVLTVLGVEGSHQRNMLALRSAVREVGSSERTMSMHEFELHLPPVTHEGHIDIRHTISIRMTERNRNRNIPVDRIRRSVDYLLRFRGIRRDNPHVVALLMQPIRIVLRR